MAGKPRRPILKRTYISPLATSDSGIGMLFLDHGNWLSTKFGMTIVNIFKASHFLSCFLNLRALQTYPLYPILILHIVPISRRGMKTCTSEKPHLSFPSMYLAHTSSLDECLKISLKNKLLLKKRETNAIAKSIFC